MYKKEYSSLNSLLSGDKEIFYTKDSKLLCTRSLTISSRSFPMILKTSEASALLEPPPDTFYVEVFPSFQLKLENEISILQKKDKLFKPPTGVKYRSFGPKIIKELKWSHQSTMAFNAIRCSSDIVSGNDLNINITGFKLHAVEGEHCALIIIIICLADLVIIDFNRDMNFCRVLGLWALRECQTGYGQI